jgi:regulator of sigma E protease
VDFVYFVVLTSALIFVHEFGHFVVAKFFGVKVLTFSIGFGPKVLRLRGKETEYCLALLPFGGFVKMLEESKQEEPLLPEEKRRSFEAQAVWKRTLIVLAGPAMNVLFPILLYTTVFLEDRAFAPAVVGTVEPGKAAEGKLMPGDNVVAIDGVPVGSFPELQAIVADKAGRPLKFAVERDGKPVDVWVTPHDEVDVLEPRELELVTHVGRVGISPRFLAPVIGVKVDSRAHKAGLRTFDRIVSINGRRVERYVDLLAILAQNRGDSVRVEFMRPTPTSLFNGLTEIGVMTAGEIDLTPAPKDADAHTDDYYQRERDVGVRIGVESAEMYVAFVPEGSSEWQAGLRAGDRVLTLDGREMKRWSSLLDDLQRYPTRERSLSWSRDGQVRFGRFQMRTEAWTDDVGQKHERYVFRTTHWAPDAPSKTVPNPHPFLYAVRRGLEQTGNVIRFILVGFLRIAQGKVSLATVSGPITMYDVAGQAGAKGTADFLWAMALVSLNLGLVNLLPIPVLDGGHLLFFLIEGVSRRRLSVRIRERASIAGMAIMLTLMLVAFKNDVTRRWDDIVTGVKELGR